MQQRGTKSWCALPLAYCSVPCFFVVLVRRGTDTRLKRYANRRTRHDIRGQCVIHFIWMRFSRCTEMYHLALSSTLKRLTSLGQVFVDDPYSCDEFTRHSSVASGGVRQVRCHRVYVIRPPSPLQIHQSSSLSLPSSLSLSLSSGVTLSLSLSVQLVRSVTAMGRSRPTSATKIATIGPMKWAIAPQAATPSADGIHGPSHRTRTLARARTLGGGVTNGRLAAVIA